MAHGIRRVEYFHTTAPDQPGEAFRFLSALADVGVNLVAFTAVPVGPSRTQLTVFPDDPARFQTHTMRLGLEVDGPWEALLVQGPDAPGALVGIHERLYQADVNVYATSGVASGDGGYGYVIYLRPGDVDRGVAALGI